METNWTKHWKINYGSFIWKAWVMIINRAYKNLLKNVNVIDAKILELGSGSGVNSLFITKILKAKEIYLVDFNRKALDISKKMIKNANLAVDVNYLRRNIIDLNLKEQFDIVHSEGLIEHFYGKDRTTVFKKHIDFCNEGGFIVIFVPYMGLKYNLLTWVGKKMKKWDCIEEPFSKQELQGLCKQFNLKIQKEYICLHEIGILIKKSAY